MTKNGGKAKPQARDYREMGPFTRCPACDSPMMVAFMQLDPETFMPAMWLLDVTCADCSARYKSACPADRILHEQGLNAPEEGDEWADGTEGSAWPDDYDGEV